MKKAFFAVAIIFISVVFISGCTEQQAEIKEITIDGHGNQVYQFSYDIRESQKIASDDPLAISMLVANSDYMNIVFDGSDNQDNGYFQVVLINIVQKLTTYYSYEGKAFSGLPIYYYITENNTIVWYNSAQENITEPDLSGTTLWLLGPSTGANETSVRLNNNTIYIQGTSYKNLTLAGDKFALIFMNQ